MNKQEFETMIDERLATMKKEFMNVFNKMYLNSLYGINANICPEDEATFYFVNSFGQVVKDTWGDTIRDNQKFAIGNYFKTEKEAYFEAERRKVIAELERFAEPKDSVWDGKKAHWSIYYDIEDKCLTFSAGYIFKHGHLYFASDYDARKAVKAVGEQRFKKYYLRVEE